MPIVLLISVIQMARVLLPYLYLLVWELEKCIKCASWSNFLDLDKMEKQNYVFFFCRRNKTKLCYRFSFWMLNAHPSKHSRSSKSSWGLWQGKLPSINCSCIVVTFLSDFEGRILLHFVILREIYFLGCSL